MMPRFRADLLEDETFKLWVRKRYFRATRTRDQAEDLISGLSVKDFCAKYRVTASHASALWLRLARGYLHSVGEGHQHAYDIFFTKYPTRYDFAEHCLKTHSQLDTIQIDDLILSTRAGGVLKRSRIRTVQELLDTSAAELLQRPNFGVVSLREIETLLDGYGLHLREGPRL